MARRTFEEALAIIMDLDVVVEEKIYGEKNFIAIKSIGVNDLSYDLRYKENETFESFVTTGGHYDIEDLIEAIVLKWDDDAEKGSYTYYEYDDCHRCGAPVSRLISKEEGIKRLNAGEDYEQYSNTIIAFSSGKTNYTHCREA